MMRALIGALVVWLAGCVQLPTQDTQVVDDRPGIAFSLPSESVAAYELRVDGVSYGEVGRYREGERLLKLVDGTHRVELVDQGEVVFSKKVYLGAGVNRVIKVVTGE